MIPKQRKYPVSQNQNLDVNVGRKPKCYLTPPPSQHSNAFFLQILSLTVHLSLITRGKGRLTIKEADNSTLMQLWILGIFSFVSGRSFHSCPTERTSLSHFYTNAFKYLV